MAGGHEESLKQRIRQAVEQGDVDTLRAVSASDLNLANDEWEPLMSLALWARQVEVMAVLVDAGVAWGWWYVHVDAFKGDWTALRSASEEELAMVTQYGETVLHAAVMGGSARAVEMVVNLGGDPLATDLQGETALHFASLHGHTHLLERLVQLGVDPRATTHHLETALHAAAKHGHVQVVEVLVGLGTPVGAEDMCGDTALHYAANYGHAGAVRKLVELGADINAANETRGETALHAAASSGHAHLVALLAELGADLAARARSGDAVVHIAAAHGQVEVLKLLGELGVDIGVLDGRGENALHRAALTNNTDAVRQLVRMGLRVDSTTPNGETALHKAAWGSDCVDAVRTLLELGAQRCTRDRRGWRPLQCSIAMDSPAAIELLETYFPITPSIAQLLLGLTGPTESSLTRFSSHALFEPHVLSLVKSLLTGEDNAALEELQSVGE